MLLYIPHKYCVHASMVATGPEICDIITIIIINGNFEERNWCRQNSIYLPTRYSVYEILYNLFLYHRTIVYLKVNRLCSNQKHIKNMKKENLKHPHTDKTFAIRCGLCQEPKTLTCVHSIKIIFLLYCFRFLTQN